MLNLDKKSVGWEIEVNLKSISESEAIIIPDGVNDVSCTVSLSGGAAAKLQTSTDLMSVIVSGSPVWIDWDAGEVEENTQDSCEQVNAIRLVQTKSGASKLTIRAQ